MRSAPVTSEPAGSPRATPSDESLVLRLMQDDASLTPLMERYDRLVRFRIFRLARQECLRDPQWLDSVASQVWTGFVRSMRRPGAQPPDSVATYLLQTCRNLVVSALRRARLDPLETGLSGGVDAFNTAETESSSSTLEELELLIRLKECLNSLSHADMAPVSQLSLIMERRWTEASRNLGMSESTLRSKWKHVLDGLRSCLDANLRET